MKILKQTALGCVCFGLILGCQGTAQPKQAAKAQAADPVAYGIGPDDVLQVDVWKRPELSREVTVRPDGFISLPLVNDVRAVGLTAHDLGLLLKEKFREFMEEPEVTVIVRAANSYKIYVVGKVTTSGMFTVKTPTSVLQAVAMAGGFTTFASPDDMVVLRKEEGQNLRIEVDYGDIVSGKHPERNIILKPGDTLVVP
jgi:polysaccharide export outer membrane protein